MTAPRRLTTRISCQRYETDPSWTTQRCSRCGVLLFTIDEQTFAISQQQRSWRSIPSILIQHWYAISHGEISDLTPIGFLLDIRGGQAHHRCGDLCRRPTPRSNLTREVFFRSRLSQRSEPSIRQAKKRKCTWLFFFF